MWSFVLDQLVELWNPPDFDETVAICISLCVCGCVCVCVCARPVCVTGPNAGMKMNCNYSPCLFDADGCWWHCCAAVARRRVCLPCVVVFLFTSHQSFFSVFFFLDFICIHIQAPWVLCHRLYALIWDCDLVQMPLHLSVGRKCARVCVCVCVCVCVFECDRNRQPRNQEAERWREISLLLSCLIYLFRSELSYSLIALSVFSGAGYVILLGGPSKPP